MKAAASPGSYTAGCSITRDTGQNPGCWRIVALGGVEEAFTDMIVSGRRAERAVLATVVRRGRRGATVGVASRDLRAHLVVDLAHRVLSQAQGEATGAAVAGLAVITTVP